jgi:hypothetical protein
VTGVTMIVQFQGYLNSFAFVVSALRLPGEPAKPNHVATFMGSRLALLPSESLNRLHFFFKCRCHYRAYRMCRSDPIKKSVSPNRTEWKPARLLDPVPYPRINIELQDRVYF